MSDTLSTFANHLREHGLAPGQIIADGQLHRCPTVTKPQKRNGAYIAHSDSPSTIWWCNWETGQQGTYSGQPGKNLSPMERAALLKRLEKNKAQQATDRNARYTEAAEKARSILRSALPCPPEHPYLLRKGIPPLGNIRKGREGEILIPILGQGEAIQSLQRISPDGTKRFLTGGKTGGGYFLIPGESKHVAAICEGYATGASVHMALGCPVYIAFSAGNLPAVAELIRRHYPSQELLICADNDAAGTGKAIDAAQRTGGRHLVPRFNNDGSGTDFNDLHAAEGLDEVRRQLTEPEPLLAVKIEKPRLVAFDLTTFLAMPLPERGFLLFPVIPEQGTAILYAPRGVGKTFVAITIAVAVAAGEEVFFWRAPAPRKVLYVDGEMPATTMQERLAALVSGMAVPPHALDNLSIITPDLQGCPMPDLSTSAGQAMLEPFLKGVDLVILDNIATLCRSGKENESYSWIAMQSWLLDLRRRGISVLLVHHAGKNGDQRGTSAREDILDTVISLRRPREYSMAEGARFEVHLTKARGIVGDEAKAFEAHLMTEDSALNWNVKEIEDEDMEQLKLLLENGKFSLRQAAKEMGKSKSTIHRLKNKLDGQT